MEVFMRQVPATLTDQSLHTQLKDKISSLGIKVWHCQKQRGSPLAALTFLDREDGQLFLRQYGEMIVPGITRNGRPRTRGRLTLLNTTVCCKESNQDPDLMTLKVLEKQVEDREQTKDLEIDVNTNVTMSLDSLSCGHYDYPNDCLAYMIDMNLSYGGTIKFAKHMVIVTYHDGALAYRLEIPYRIMEETVVSNNPRALTMTLWEAPRFFISDTSLVQGSQSSPRTRITHLPHRAADHSKFIGQSLVYQFTTTTIDLRDKMNRVGEEKGLFLKFYKTLATEASGISMGDSMAALSRTLGQVDRHIPFDVAFQFHQLALGGYILPQTIRALVLRLEKYAVDAARTAGSNFVRNFCPVSAMAVKKLLMIGFAGPSNEADTFSINGLWNELLEYEKEVRLELAQDLISSRANKSMVCVIKVQVTPTRLIFSGPELEPNNRVLRKYPNHTEYFARLQLCEEDGQDIFYNPRVNMEEIYTRYRTILRDGIQICGRVYKFLGFSHSSLRAHAIWAMASFYDPENNCSRNYFNVIAELGSFKNITSPARRAARIGQAFSDTRVSISLAEHDVHVDEIRDVKSADGSRVFSDGVGTISRRLLEIIWDSIPGQPTCLQIRWAGAKGMLSLDDTLKGITMRIRPESMIKFESNDNEYLEICDAATKAVPLVMNRQMIKILEDMGVPYDWFSEEQAKEVSRLRTITADIENTITFLKRQKVGDQLRFSNFIRRIHELGLSYKTDRWLCTVVESVVLRELRLLKNKARIPVDAGVTLFGIMDEFSFLGEDEIFVTFDGLEGRDFMDLGGKMMAVTRSPALHPGDIQLARNVVPPDWHPLRSLRNCIVFSQKGKRDLPSQLSGGDLDGDKFSVIWDERVTSNCTYISTAADYPRVPPLQLDRDVEIADIINFFVDFMATDQLGLIATRHLIYADRYDSGASSSECLKLAELHSTAVDYSKTGVPVDKEELKIVKPPRQRPDFMSPTSSANLKDRSEIVFDTQMLPAEEFDEDDNSGPTFQYYKSEKILGSLFRSIDEEMIWKKDIQAFVEKKGATLWDQLATFVKHNCVLIGDVAWQECLSAASNIHDTFNDALWALILDFSESAGNPISELEVFTGQIFHARGLPTKRQGERSLQLKEEFDRLTRWIESLIRQHEMKEHIEDEDEYNEEEAVPKPTHHGSGLGSQTNGHKGAVGPTGLQMSVACLHVAITRPAHAHRKARRMMGHDSFQSFKIIAAACALREIERASDERQQMENARWQAVNGMTQNLAIGARVAVINGQHH